jgi:hypothetical protein
VPQVGTGHSGFAAVGLDAVPRLTFGLAQLVILRSRGNSGTIRYGRAAQSFVGRRCSSVPKETIL